MDRKLVKQTVMTSVYGVTYIGARDQIKRRLKERGAIADDAELFGCACYAAKVGKGGFILSMPYWFTDSNQKCLFSCGSAVACLCPLFEDLLTL